MYSLAQALVPVGFSDILSAILATVGIGVIALLTYRSFKEKDVKPFVGMPALAIYMLFLAVTLGGTVIDLASYFGAFAPIIGFVVNALSTVLLVPFLVSAALSVTGVHIWGLVEEVIKK